MSNSKSPRADIAFGVLNQLHIFNLARPILQQVDNATISPLNPLRDRTLTDITRLLNVRRKIQESYERLKNALIEMQHLFVASKNDRNVFSRYSKLRKMVENVVSHDKQYWSALDIPEKGPKESQADYVNRLSKQLGVLESERGASTSTPRKAPISARDRSVNDPLSLVKNHNEFLAFQELKNKPVEDLRHEQVSLQAGICALAKKYLDLKVLVVELETQWEVTKNVPMILRYSMLKEMIKGLLRDPRFTEFCYEDTDVLNE